MIDVFGSGASQISSGANTNAHAKTADEVELFEDHFCEFDILDGRCKDGRCGRHAPIAKATRLDA
jgi:hypothetical protein